MKRKMNKKSIIALAIVVLLALFALGSWFIWQRRQHPVVEHNPIEEQEEDTTTAAVLVLDYNNVSLGLDHSFTVQAKTYWNGEEVDEKIEYTWEMDEDGSADVASMKASGDSATITGMAYGDTAYTVSAKYRDTLLVKKLSVHVGNLDVIFDSPNMELSAGCYTVNLGLLETEKDVTSMIPKIYVYDNEELVNNPEFTWTNSDESIAVRDASGRITAKKAGTTLIIGKYKESELHIRVNVYRSQVQADPVYIESYRNYVLSFPKLKGMTVEEVLFNDVNVLKGYNKNSGTITFDSEMLPQMGTAGTLLIRTDKMEMIMDAMVCTMAIYQEADLNQMASVIESNGGKGYYVLARDIQCAGTYDAGITVEFAGTFDGCGNTIYNMTTSDRDGSNRGLLGGKMGTSGVIRNVSFVGAKHGGKGAFFATSNAGVMKNIYIQIEITDYNKFTWDNATSVLGSSTMGVTTTENVWIEYMNPLPADATNGFAIWGFNYGHAKHQGLYVVGADRVSNNAKDLGGGLKDLYGAYLTYGDFLDAGIDVSAWENDFWTVQNGIPYPVKLAKRTGTVPNVSIPEYVAAGNDVKLNGATIYDRVVLSAAAKKLGVTVKGNVLSIPKTVSAGKKITFTVQSAFDASKKVALSTTVLAAKSVTMQGIYDAELYGHNTFSVDLGSVASQIEGAELFYVTVDGQELSKKLYTNGALTVDTASLGDVGAKTMQATFKKGNTLIIVTIPIDVCTMAINDEADLKNMASVITANNGEGRYVLAKDILCTESYDANIQTSFVGTFDGRGYTIYNMKTSDRDGNNRGLLGKTIGTAGVVQNVSFVNASHGGKGAFLASSNGGTMSNIYIQIAITDYNTGSYDNATSVLGSSTMGVTTTEKVLIEYLNPLPSDATNGYGLWQLHYGYGKHQGLYAIGADSVSCQSVSHAGEGGDVFGAYRNYGDYLLAGEDLTSWENDFWAVYNKIPYPRNLGTRVGEVPEVTIPKYVGAGSDVVLDGLTMYERVVLNSNMTKLGLTVKDGILTIPKSVPLGTVVRMTVESVFDSSKKTTLQATVYETVNMTLQGVRDVVTWQATTFDIDFGTQASAVEGGTLISAAVGNSSFAKATYSDSVLTLDTSTLTSFGEQTVTVVFDKDNKLVTVTIYIDVCTMVITTEDELNSMAAVIVANEGDGRYVLGEDIYCTGVYDANITAEFKGTFDGRGYTIYNMTTSDRDGNNRGLLGKTIGTAGVVQNVSFVDARHGGKGAFLASSNGGTMKNVYIQIAITDYNSSSYDNATSVLGSSTMGVTATEKVWIEYTEPLSTEATNGYAFWKFYYGYGKHQGLYVIGADSVCKTEEQKAGAGGDEYGAYGSYGDYLAAGVDVASWANEFWTVTNGIPYPTHLGVREGVVPTVSIPEITGPGSEVVLDGLTMYDKVELNTDAKALGITVSDNILCIPESVPSGTTVGLTVKSVFDAAKKVDLTIDVLISENIALEKTTVVEVYDVVEAQTKDYFTVDLTDVAEEIGAATLVSASVDGTAFVEYAYADGLLTLDTISLVGWGKKTVSVTFRGTENLISITLLIDVCTMAIDSEADLNAMAGVIVANSGDGQYIMTADVTCEGVYDANITAEFKGTFDGRGYTIYNMTTSDRDGNNRGLLGKTIGTAGVVQNVSFVDARHGGKGAFLASSNGGTMKNVYIQIAITDYNSNSYDNATSVLGSSTMGVTATEKVWIEYAEPLSTEATNGYAFWQFYYGYGKHQGLYVIGADSVCKTEVPKAGAGGDEYGAYGNYGDYLAAGVDVASWANEFWTVTNGIPYPTHLGVREGVVPTVSIPAVTGPGSSVVLDGATIYDSIILATDAQTLGVTVSRNVMWIPDTVLPGTTIRLTVQSAFDATKKVELTTEVLTTKNVALENVTAAEVYNKTSFAVDLTAMAAEIGSASVVSATVGEAAFASAVYADGILTLDTGSLTELGQKTVSVTLKGSESLYNISIPVDVCTMAIDSEADLNAMPTAIVKNSGAGRYILTADITCQGTYDAKCGITFVGTFDGCGHTIYNMTTSSERDGNNRGLLGSKLGSAGVVQNVSFVNASHGGKGAFIATSCEGGTLKNLYIQINITSYNTNTYNNATSVLSSNPLASTSTQNVLIEYINPLPADATNGYAFYILFYGYGKHQGLYAVGADSVYKTSSKKSTGTDYYGAFADYDALKDAGIDWTKWDTDFWTIEDGRPYPKNLNQ